MTIKKILFPGILGLATTFASPAFYSTEAMAETTSADSEHVSDTWLEAKLVTIYTLNSELSIFDIDVDVRDQVAYLTGTVDSQVEKDLATEIADSVDGVQKIENTITVVASEKSDSTRTSRDTSDKSFMQTVSDLTTTASIKSRLLANSEIDGLDINVTTDRDVVTLKGIVNSETHSALAEKIAENTDGVTRVVNQLEVKAQG